MIPGARVVKRIAVRSRVPMAGLIALAVIATALIAAGTLSRPGLAATPAKGDAVKATPATPATPAKK